jgi:hypothetical protein
LFISNPFQQLFILAKKRGLSAGVILSVQGVHNINVPACFIPAHEVRRRSTAHDHQEYFEQHFYGFSYKFCDRSYWNHDNDAANNLQSMIANGQALLEEEINTAAFVLSESQQIAIIKERNRAYDIGNSSDEDEENKDDDDDDKSDIDD